MQDNPGAFPTRTLLDGVALSDYLAHLARNLPDLAERGAYGTLLVLVMAAGFVLAWLIQASRRQRVVRRIIETHIQEERAEQEEQAEKARAENLQAGLAAAFEAAPPQIGIPLSDLQRLIEARDKRVAEAAAESVIAGLEAAFRRTV